jgi:hypothetical protein
MLGRVAVEMKVCLCRALIPSVEGALPQGETRLSHSVSTAILASVGAVSPPALTFPPPAEPGWGADDVSREY